MGNKKLWIINWVGAALALLVVSDIACYAQVGISAREKKRNEVPIDQLMQRLESPKRIEMMQPERVLALFEGREGEIIADVGAGTGFFSFRQASRVGPQGKVYAVEIEDKLLDYIGKKMAEEKVTNISLIKSTETDPNLPSGSCDKIMVFGSYYYFPEPIEFMKNVRKALKTGGLVAVIDLDKDKVFAHRKTSGKKEKDYALKVKTKSAVVEEMKIAGFVLRESHDFLARRFFMIFSVDDEAISEVDKSQPLEK